MSINKKFGIVDAIQSLAPTAEWTLNGDKYDGLEWRSEGIKKPSEKALASEVSRLQSEYDALEYQRLRSTEYPDFKDYLDGVVKGDQAQIDAYIAACQAVKDKYPKAE
jgi:tRNA A37 N6-isopentenylltransferase MiaA